MDKAKIVVRPKINTAETLMNEATQAATLWLAQHAAILRNNPNAIHMSVRSYIAAGGARMVADALKAARAK